MTQNIIIVCGPTATGKSDLAVSIARKIKGEIISADSRQVYKKLDIGTGKITTAEMKGVPHYMLDVVKANRIYNVSSYQKAANKHINDILNRGLTPIICGGTGFYIDSIVYNTNFVDVNPNKELRKKLAKLDAPKLFEMLLKLDPERADTIDKHNRVRLIRAIEIAKELGKVPPISKNKKYNTTYIGIDFDDEVLKKRIKLRVESRIKQGMFKEAERLHKNGLSLKRMRELGLEYGHLADYLIEKKKLEKLNLNHKIHEIKEKFVDSLSMDIWHYAKRQRTWFRKNKDIHWIMNPKNKAACKKEALAVVLDIIV